MAGNVRDWCRDRWVATGPTLDPEANDASAGLSLGLRSARGGAWAAAGYEGRVTMRLAGAPDTTSFHVGIRLVRSL